MSTPLGWARANLYYDKLKDIPSFGSLREAACLLVWKNRIEILQAQTRATAQAALGGENAEKAFNDLISLINRVEISDKKDKMSERLKNLRDIKEIRFRPSAMPKSTSPLKKVKK